MHIITDYSQGHEKEALNLMSSYLPKDTTAGSAYSEGGGLYALGLIHANHGGEITEYLLGQLKDASTDVSLFVCGTFKCYHYNAIVGLSTMRDRRCYTQLPDSDVN